MHAFYDAHDRIAGYLHERVCPGHRDPVAPEDCLYARSAVDEFSRELATAGLAVVPAEIAAWLGGLVGDAPAALEDPPTTGSESEARARAQVWIEVRMADGHVERRGPYPRTWAEVFLADLAASHGPDERSAIILDEPGWVGHLMRQLAGP